MNQVHPKGDLSGLHEAVGTEVLPEELGGTNGKIQDHIGKSFVTFSFVGIGECS